MRPIRILIPILTLAAGPAFAQEGPAPGPSAEAKPEAPVPAPAPAEVKPAAVPKPEHTDVAPLFTQDRDNYFITGLPSTRDWDNLSDATRPRIRFQLSFKYNLAPNFGGFAAFFGFTQKSIWDLWNWAGSAPFEDSNYNPSLFLAYRPGGYLKSMEPTVGWRFLGARLGFEHESNGQAGAISRGWNRASGSMRLGYYWDVGVPEVDYLHLIVDAKGWYPWVEGLDASGGGNPDLIKYYGYAQGSLEVGYDIPVATIGGRTHYQRIWAVGVLGRVGSAADRAYVEAWLRVRPRAFGWFGLSFFVQGVAGYGETLLRYNVRQAPTVRFGFALDDLLSTETLATGG